LGASRSTIGLPNFCSGRTTSMPASGVIGVAGADHHDRLAMDVLRQEGE
jgi:hypothetical protein